MRLLPQTKKLLVIGFLATTALNLETVSAQAYDMDCKVILCIAGGFPSGCSDAYSYMIKRITRFPKPLPPFGFCAMSDGSEYTAHNVNYSYLGRGPQAYDCPKSKKLFYRREESDSGNWGSETAFCYTHTTTQRDYSNDGYQMQTIYHGQSQAIPVNFQLEITIEPGTDIEYKSPLYRINYHTGYVSKRGI